MLFQMKQVYDWLAIAIVIYHTNKGHANLDITDVEEVAHVSSYPMPEAMYFDTDISDEVAKMRAATILRYIVRLDQCN